MKYKLVRDNIPSIIKVAGNGSCSYAQCKSKEFLVTLLKEKLIEEVNELFEAINTDESQDTNHIYEEFADVQTVLESLAFELNLKNETITRAHDKKLLERGGFKEGYILFFEE